MPATDPRPIACSPFWKRTGGVHGSSSGSGNDPRSWTTSRHVSAASRCSFSFLPIAPGIFPMAAQASIDSKDP